MKRTIVLSIIVGVFGLLVGACSSEPSTPSYTNFKILSVKITAMPFIDASNSGWDPLDGPDVFFNIETTAGDVLVGSSADRFKDIGPNDLPVGWNLVTAHEVNNLSVARAISVYDYDSLDPNDLIGKVTFDFNSEKSGYPKSISKSGNGVTVVVTGEWY